jgi:phage virion morphogenesis protein
MKVNLHDQGVRDYFNQLLAKVSDLTPVLDGIGMELESRVSGRFETQSDPTGQAWAPWAASTANQYPSDGNGTILDRYGDMLLSLSHQASATDVVVGFGQPYATYHEFGTRKMPRRGLLTADPTSGEISQGDQEAILDILAVYLEG